MIRVIRKSGQKEVECSVCETLLSYAPNDVESDYTYAYKDEMKLYFFIKCPCCHTQVIVEKP